MLCLLHLGEAGGLPVTAGVPIVVINQEEYLDGSGEADYMPVTTDVPGTREEKYLDGSGEDDNLPGYIGVSIVILYYFLLYYIILLYYYIIFFYCGGSYLSHYVQLLNNWIMLYRKGTKRGFICLTSSLCAFWYQKLL